MDDQHFFEIMDAANQAHRERAAQQHENDRAVLDLVKAMVTASVFSEIESELSDSDSAGGYKIVDAPAGQPQDNGFSLGDVYVDQFCGMCEDDFYGTVALPLPDGRYFQFSYCS